MNEIVKNRNEQGIALKPWSQNPGEPFMAYNNFEIYLAMGSSRSLKRMADVYGIELNKLYKWSSRWNWNKRALLYDEVKQEIVKNEILTEIEIRNKMVAQKRQELSEITDGAYNDLIRYLKDYWRQYQNPDIIKKVRYVRELSSTLKQLLNLSYVNLSHIGTNDLADRDIKINNVLNLKNDMQQVNIEKANIYSILQRFGLGDFLPKFDQKQANDDSNMNVQDDNCPEKDDFC